MATVYYRQSTTGGGSHIAKRSKKQGRRALPKELKAVRINITLTPQAHERGKQIAADCGKTFSAWIEDKIYTHRNC